MIFFLFTSHHGYWYFVILNYSIKYLSLRYMYKFIIYSVLLVLISTQLDIYMNDIDARMTLTHEWYKHMNDLDMWMALTHEWHWHMNDISDIYRDFSSPQILTLHVHVSHKTPCLSYHTTDTSEFPVWILSSLELVHNIRCWTLHCMWKLHQYSIWNCYLYLAHSPWNLVWFHYFSSPLLIVLGHLFLVLPWSSNWSFLFSWESRAISPPSVSKLSWKYKNKICYEIEK